MSAEVQSVCGIYDDRLQFIVSRDDALAWVGIWRIVMCRTLGVFGRLLRRLPLQDAYQFSGGPVPDNCLVLGGGAFLVRTVRLGGPKVRKVVGTLRIHLREVMCSCIMMLLPLSCWI